MLPTSAGTLHDIICSLARPPSKGWLGFGGVWGITYLTVPGKVSGAAHET